MAAPFAILNTRKRIVIALIHSIFFLALAVRDVAASAHLRGVLEAHVAVGSIALVCVYVIVSAILITLFGYSAGYLERLYFGFCAASASSGLIRAIVGDAHFAAGSYLRVFMLLCAVLTGWISIRSA